MDSLSGRFMLYAVGSALVAVPVAVALLQLFRRSVVRGMRKLGDDTAEDTHPPVEPAWRAEAPKPTLPLADQSLVAALSVYILAAFAVAAVFTAAIATQAGEPTFLQLMFWFPQYTMPVIFVGWVVLPKGPARTAFVTLAVVLFFVLSLIPVALAGQASVLSVVFVLVWPAVPAALLIALFMTRRIRASGPLVLMIVTGSVLGWNLIFDAAEFSPRVMSAMSLIGAFTGGVLLLFGIFAIGSVIGVLATWPALRALGLAYRAKLISDQSLVLDVVLLWFCAFFASELASEAPLWMVSGLVAFVVYKAVTLVGFGLLALARRQEPHADILLLRPFALGRRSERLFDQLSKVWLRIGAIHMIAGPDLVMATVAPPEFLMFLAGKISRRFIQNREDLQEHLGALDLDPDPDGRYRVNQLFCRDNVWRDAMRALATMSGAVLMDLRGFTVANQGCSYEIAELIRGVPLSKVVFAVDETTDMRFLAHVAEDVRRAITATSPNAAMTDIASRIVSVDNSARGRRLLLGALMDASAA